jgi:putrescine transport system permease protein
MSARRRPPRWRGVALILGLGFLYVPIGWIALYSFSGSPVVGIWTGFSLRWYREILDNDGFRDAAARSLLLAAVAATVATMLGTVAGYALAQRRTSRARGVLTGLLAVPLFVPEILIGFSLLMLFVGLESLTGLPLGKGFVPLVIGHATMGLPICASVVFARLSGLDPSFEEAARDLGARPLRVLLTVTLPLALPALLSGWMLAFTLSFDDVITSSFLAGPANTTLPMLVYSTVRVGVNPLINVTGTLIVVGVSVLVSLAMLRGRFAPGLGRGTAE